MTQPGGPKEAHVRIAQRDAVGWFDPRSLFPTAQRALVSALLGERTGRREILAALDTPIEGVQPPLIPRSVEGYHDHRDANEPPEFWLDYVADLGDGFNATHSVAWLIGRDYVFAGRKAEDVEQPVPTDLMSECGSDAAGEGRHALPAGSVLVMGGDQAYPYGSPENYRDRLADPYFAARPWGKGYEPEKPLEGRRALYAIPGNHDWYDGLSSFLRQFCQPGRWIGCWQTQQRRSYFALRLPHDVWLWGIDTAMEDEIDPPQLAFFEKQATLIEPHHRLILVVPNPSWTECDGREGLPDEAKERSWLKLRKIMSLVTGDPAKVAEPELDKVPLVIAGDLHQYARYEEAASASGAARHFVTCGMGGAYTLGTLRNPETLACENGRMAQLKESFPSKADSRSLRKGVFKLAFRYPFFTFLLSAALLATIWIIRSGLRFAEPVRFLPEPSPGWFWENLRLVGGIITTPSTALATAAVLGLFIAFAKSGAHGKFTWLRWLPAGFLHGALQLAAAGWITDSVLRFIRSSGGYIWLNEFFGLVVVALLTFAIAGLLFPLYLLLSNIVLKLHEEELYSAQAITEFKGFLRIRITAEAITIYPLVLRTISKEWKLAVSAPCPPTSSGEGRLTRLQQSARSGLEKTRAMLPDLLRITTRDIRVPPGTTHIFNPEKPLAVRLIEEPIVIPLPIRADAPQGQAAASGKAKL